MLEGSQEGRCSTVSWSMFWWLRSVMADTFMFLRYKKLTQEEALVFSYIESAGRDGLWTLAIRARTNLHISVFNRCLKTLESQNLVKGVFSAKFPGRKVYILAHLQPSEDISGGPFYTEGKLDDEFVHQLGVWSEKYVAGRSWSHSTVKEPKRKRDISNLTAAQAEDLKAQEFRGEEPAKQRSRRVILPLPPGYTGYPTVPEITKAANESRITPVSLKEAEMRQVMDTLCWDGRVMKVMDGKAYKTVHPAGREDDRDLENGLTESPCGHCPVFDLCEEGGPVNARSCTYFQDWLAF